MQQEKNSRNSFDATKGAALVIYAAQNSLNRLAETNSNNYMCPYRYAASLPGCLAGWLSLPLLSAQASRGAPNDSREMSTAR